nr:caspase family protein [Microvirga sp. ACRRW]
MKRAIVFAVFALTAFAGSVSAASAQQRLALVIGQSAYEGRQLATAANDAGLIAQTLTSAGFEVVQGRDLNANDLRNVVRDFLDKAQTLESDGAVMVYLSGYGIQLEGENYLLPVDARIQRDVDVPMEGFRLSDLVRSLERTPAKTRMVVADMARDYAMPAGSEPIARGLALVEPPSGFLIAFSSAPNITTGDAPGPYGHYATALAETIRQPGVPVDEVFNRVRLRTHETTKGLQTPWHTANLGNASFVFFEPSESASAAPPPVRQVRRIEDVPAEEAYNIAVERDTIQDYQAFLRRYPDHPLSRRVSALLAARREAIVWRQTVRRNTNEAYWTYLRRYPNGPHAADSRRRLARLSAPIAPPPVFDEFVYEDLPPPLPDVERIEVVEVVTIIRDAPPPPPPPIYLLPDYEEDVEFVEIIREPPPPPILVGVLPIPAPFPVPRYARPPRSYYEPIAPVTPRGPVFIPVARPPVRDPLLGSPDRPQWQRAPRPTPVVPRQPGLTAQPVPISVPARPSVVNPQAPGPRTEQPRLPSRPIPIAPDARPGADRPMPPVTAPGTRPQPPVAARPEPGPVRLPPPDGQPAARPQALPPAPSAQRPGVNAERPVAPRIQPPGADRDPPPGMRPQRPAAGNDGPAAPRARPPEENFQAMPRPQRPRIEEERPRPASPAAQPRQPQLEPPRAVQPMRPNPPPEARPRIAPPEFRQPAQPRPMPQPMAPQPMAPQRMAPQPMPPQARPAPDFRPSPPPQARPQPMAPMARPAPQAPQPQRVAPQAPNQRPQCLPGRPCRPE